MTSFVIVVHLTHEMAYFCQIVAVWPEWDLINAADHLSALQKAHPSSLQIFLAVFCQNPTTADFISEPE